MNIITKIKQYIARPKGFKRLDIVERVVLQQQREISALNDTTIALARLNFVKPEVLYRETFNTKANTEYMLKLVELKNKDESK